MQFTKIRFDGEKVELKWHEQHGEETREVHFTSNEAPLPGLPAALKAFAGPIMVLLGLPGDYGAQGSVRSVSIRDKEGSSGIVASMTVPSSFTNGPFVINTPLAWQQPEDDNIGVIADLFECLATLKDEATKYLTGERAQMELPTETTDEGTDVDEN